MLGAGLACGKFNTHPSVLPEPKEGMVASGQGPVGREGSEIRLPEPPAYPSHPLDTPGLSERQSLLLQGTGHPQGQVSGSRGPQPLHISQK